MLDYSVIAVDVIPKWLASLTDEAAPDVLAVTAKEQKTMFLQAYRQSKLIDNPNLP
jgi:hypothetical protein